MKPREYQLAYSVVHETAYHCDEPDGTGALPKHGFLQPGRVVWLDHSPRDSESCVRGYIEGAGIAALDPHRIHRA